MSACGTGLYGADGLGFLALQDASSGEGDEGIAIVVEAALLAYRQQSYARAPFINRN